MRFSATVDDGRRTRSYFVFYPFSSSLSNKRRAHPAAYARGKEGWKDGRKEGRKSNAGEGNHKYLAVQNTLDPSAEL